VALDVTSENQQSAHVSESSGAGSHGFARIKDHLTVVVLCWVAGCRYICTVVRELQIDVFEASVMSNIILLQTVLEEVCTSCIVASSVFLLHACSLC